MTNLLRTVRLHDEPEDKWYTVLASDANGSLLIGDRAETGPFVTNLRWISPRLVAAAGYENEESSPLEKIARELHGIKEALEERNDLQRRLQ